MKFSALASDALYFINQLRTNPQGFAGRLQELREDFRGKTLLRAEAVPILTREGVNALESALDILKRAEAQPALEFNEGLRRVAQELANYISGVDNIEAITHQPRDDLSLKKRARRYGKSRRPLVEGIDLGSVSGFEITAKLAMDDGLESRPHLRAMLDGRYTQIGIASASQSQFTSVCVVVFARGYTLARNAPKVDEAPGLLEIRQEISDWVDGAVKLQCEVTSKKQKDHVITKKYSRTWEMEDGSQKTDEIIIEEKPKREILPDSPSVKSTQQQPKQRRFNSQNPPVLGYWNNKGRGQPCRLLLRHLGVDFIDKRYTPKQVDGNWDVSEWFGEKFTLRLPFPNLPYFKDGKDRVTETYAILPTICSLYAPLYLGRNAYQKIRVIQIGSIVQQYDAKLVLSCYVPGFGQDGREGIVKFCTESLEKIAVFMKDSVLLAGNHPTWPDFWFLELLALTEVFEPGLYDRVSPKFREFVKAMNGLSGVEEMQNETRHLKVNNVFAHVNN